MPQIASKQIAMLGIGGAGMRGLATLLAEEGATIVGVDRVPPTNLVHSRIRLVKEDEAAGELSTVDYIIHTDALLSDHPLLTVARAAGQTIYAYQEFLGEYSRSKRTLAVTGTHGKSSTTSILAHIFVEAGLDPTALVGASVPAWGGSNSRFGQSQWFIVEADEYRDHFLALQPESAIITSIDFDHPDFFSSIAQVESSFAQFIQKLSSKGTLVVPEGVVKHFKSITWPATTMAVAPPREPLPLVLPGEHMQYNAWLAVQLAGVYGVNEQQARSALVTYQGLRRRFELLGQLGSMDIISDYGHHPEEMVATITAARTRYGTKPLCVVFEPHTRERFVQLLSGFTEALSLAEGIVLVPPFIPPGRGSETASALDVLQQLRERLQKQGKTVYMTDSLATVGDTVSVLADTYGVALAFSAGKLDEVLRAFVKEK